MPPSPNCPSRSDPQDQTVPSFFKAYPLFDPPAIEVMPVKPETGTGVDRSVLVPPSPNCPRLSNPQDQTVPSFFKAYPVAPPPATEVMLVKPET